MNVRDRLNRLTGEAEKREKTEIREEILTLRRRIDAIMARKPRSSAYKCQNRYAVTRVLEDVIHGSEICNDYGTFYVSRSVAEGSDSHGCRTISEIGGLNMNHAALLAADERIARSDLERGLFIDTETTGLSGGTGTTAFLIGLGWWENGSFVTEQIFLRDFSEETAALVFLRETAAKREFLITFNGKAFDIGLLSTRFILNRQRDPFIGLPHLDLLFPSRRLLGHRLENSRLVTLEEQILDFRRRGDIPGYEIPGRYFDWLGRKDAAVLEDVFLHNRLDIISMAVLAVHLAELVDPAFCRDESNDADLIAASRLLIERGELDSAMIILKATADKGCGRFSFEAKKILSLLYKRCGQWKRAVAMWEEMIDKNPGDFFALTEMAKWCEHRADELERATSLVKQALQYAEESSELCKILVHRHNRLLRKLRRARQ
ncbi:MAG: ribonuclease H-like domain-containing protein [Syntrophales bacterium]|jgi:uncharacterized protein YprB with RNaseH-like and TPR domain|nr:ribonuclease H-like domain-containing protein [Syntrophales bacterium]MDY0043578.1 ribonuclease H-like domain-containing protein [Syntrophales bacterium]